MVTGPGIRHQAFAEGDGEADEPGPGLVERHRQVKLIHSDLTVVKPAMGIVGPGAHEVPVLTHPSVNLADSSAECGSLGPLGLRRGQGRRLCNLQTDQLHGLRGDPPQQGRRRAWGTSTTGPATPGMQGGLEPNCIQDAATKSQLASLPTFGSQI